MGDAGNELFLPIQMIVLFCLSRMCRDGPAPRSFYEILDLVVTSEILHAAIVVVDHGLRIPQELAARVQRRVAKGQHVIGFHRTRDAQEVLYHAMGIRRCACRYPLRGQSQRGSGQMHV